MGEYNGLEGEKETLNSLEPAAEGDEEYRINDDAVYNPNIRKLKNEDPVHADDIFNPLIQRMIDNIHAVHKKSILAPTLPDNIVLFEPYEGPPQPGAPKDADLLDGQLPSYYAKATDVVVDYTHAKTGTLHSLTGPEGAGKIAWTMTATAEDGDSWELNGAPVAVLYNDGIPVMPHSLIAGDMLWGQVSDGKVVLTIPMPGSNENLLINWYLLDPVNQRGQEEYMGKVHSIDLWTLYNGTLNIGEEFVLNGDSSDNFLFFQHLENKEPYMDIDMTASLLCKSVTMVPPSGTPDANYGLSISIGNGNTSFGYYYDAQSDYITETNDRPFLITVTGRYSDVRKYVGFGIAINGGSVSVIAAKLELGPRQTLAHKDADGNWVLNDPPPDKATELAKCQRYQIEVFDKSVTGQSYLFSGEASHDKGIYGILPLPVTMRDGGRPILITDCSANTPYSVFGAFSNGYGEEEVTEISVLSKTNNGILLRATSENFIRGNHYYVLVKETNKHHFLLDRNL